MEEEEEIVIGAMEAVSIDNTFGEMESVIESNLPRNKIISINSVILYTTINKCKQSIAANEINMNTKYKTVDKTVKHVATPLPKDSWQLLILTLETREQ